MSRRYPLDALVAASGLTEAALGRKVGLSGSTLKLARTEGLAERSADLFACRAGLTPWLVWPDWLEDLEVECAERSCTNRFVPSKSSHRFCSRTCGNRERTRAYLARKRQDPAFREAERLRRQQNFRASRDYEARRQRLLWRTDARFRRVKRAARKRWREDPANRERENAQARERYRERSA